MQDQGVAEVGPRRLRVQLHEVPLDLHRVILGGPTEAIAEPAHVGIDHHAGSSEGDADDDVGGLPADAAEGDHLLQRARHFSIEPVHHVATHLDKASGLGPEEPGGVYEPLHLGLVRPRHHLGGGEPFEQGRRHLVHADVRALCAEDCCAEELPGAAVHQRALGIGVPLGQEPVHFGGGLPGRFAAHGDQVSLAAWSKLRVS